MKTLTVKLQTVTLTGKGIYIYSDNAVCIKRMTLTVK